MKTPSSDFEYSTLTPGRSHIASDSAAAQGPPVVAEKTVDEVLDLLASAVVADVMDCREKQGQRPRPRRT